MRWRPLLMTVALVVGVLCAGVGATPRPVAQPQAACSVPGMVQCAPGTGDPTCAEFGAVCDGVTFSCVCPSTDMGPNTDGFMMTDGGLINPDFATSGGNQPGGSMSGSPPATGGGMSAPARSGCSYVPGSAR